MATLGERGIWPLVRGKLDIPVYMGKKLGSVIPKTLKMGVVPACRVLMMKWGPQNITGRPGVSIM